MKLGTATIKRIGVGAAAIRGGYIGHLSLSSAPDGNAPSAYALLEPVGDWATWADAPAYTPALAGTVYNVVDDYEADPTGATDSTDAIRQAIIDCGVAGGGTVYIPEGTYTVWPTTEFNAETNTGPSCFLLHYSNVTIEGDGPDKTIISHRTFGGGDPNSSEVFARGFLFTTLLTPRNVENVTIRGIRATGNAHVTNQAGAYSGVGSYTGWDTTHKFLGIFMQVIGPYSCNNIVVEDCELDNWRGEICYSGGAGELGTQFVRRCIVRGSNASSISMGGIVTVEDCWIKSVYNGTECFSLTTGEGLTVTNCVINPNQDLPSGVSNIGLFGVVYLGVSDASLTVTGCDIGKTLSGAVFLSEAASNVLFENNNITDSTGIYSIYLNQYPSEPNFQAPEPNKWVGHIYRGNTLTATTRNVPAFVYSLAGEGEDWVIEDNTLVKENGFVIDKFIDSNGAAQPFTVTGNTLTDGAIPSSSAGGRPWPWNTNTIPGYYTNGQVLTNSEADTTPLVLFPSWPKINFISISSVQRRMRIGNSDDLSYLPTGFQVEFRRTGDLAANRSIEIQPDPVWNTLTRGYIIPEGALLTLTKSASGKMDLTTWTPPASSPPTFNESVAFEQFDTSNIMLFGQASATLSPSTPITYSAIYGVGIRDTVTLNYNGNVTLEHVPGMMETFSGADFVAGGSGSISAYRDMDGTVLLGDHSANEDTPLIGVTTYGAASDAGHAVRVTIIQDGDHPAAAGGYYSVERKDPGGSFTEIEQVPKGDFAGARLTATFDDTDWTAGEEYNYRVRAVDPGTPNNYSRYSNTQAQTLLAAPTDVSGLSYLLRASFSETGGTAYWFVSASATPPADITSEADPDAEYWYSTTPTRGVNSKYVTGLANGTYYLHVAQEGLTQTSAITTSAAFTVPNP